MDEHISRILKMLEEGKISANEAELLISALKKEQAAPPPTPGPPPPPPHPSPASPPPPSPDSEGTSKTFEFKWSQKRNLPFDLSNLGKQINDIVRKIDPERIVRDARHAGERERKRWQERARGWGHFHGGDDNRPENLMGWPTARSVETFTYNIAPESLVQVENNWGSITVVGGTDVATVELEKEAWAPSEEEAKAHLGNIKLDSVTPTVVDGMMDRVELRVVGPEDWRDGVVNLRLRVPDAVALRLATVYGDISVESTTNAVEVRTVSGSVRLNDLSGEKIADASKKIVVETISGDMIATNIGALVSLTTKSGEIQSENLARGGELVSISGDVKIKKAYGGRIEARSVSGDVRVEEVGGETPTDATLESVSGDLNLVRARGNVVLKCVSGDVKGERLNASTVQSQTVSGDVNLELEAEFRGALTSNTVSGDVTIRLPQISSFRFTLGTQSGDLESNLPVHDDNKTDTMWTGTVGGGEGSITVQTRSGDVNLTTSE